MRDLHQLGSNFFVFPSACHSRFEHSLGTGYLCQSFLDILKLRNPKIDIDSYTKSIVIAGLCHNIGHGPFAYPFSDFVHDVLGETKWSDENQSLFILDHLIDNNNVDITKEENDLIKDIILGENINYRTESNLNISPWVLQILNNKTSIVDIDKFDFIRRDAYKFGCPNESFDGNIVLNNARIVNDNICFRSKDAFPIYEIFFSRYRLFKEFYVHRVSKGIDLMIKDIFAEANLYYDFKSYLNDAEKFITLKDSILNDIVHSKNVTLSKAKNLVERIYKRDLYKFVGEKTCIISSSNSYEKFLNLTEEDIINCASSDDYKDRQLVQGDIKILRCQLDFGKGEDDPIESVNFYDIEDNEYVMKKVNKQEVSLLTPSNFKEFIFRVYVKDQEKLQSAKVAFTKFCSEKTGESPNHYEKSASKMERY